MDEEIRIHDNLRPKLATPNRARLDLRSMVLRDYGTEDGLATLVIAPFAGHTAVIADYHRGQSLIETLLANGITRLALTDWKSATDDMKDLEIDNYLADMIVAIDDLGGRVNLVGLCQGGWVAAMVAARFPEKVNSLVLAGAPIDTDAGDGPIKRMAHASPLSFYKELVALGGGLMKGKFMLQGWKNMHPEQHYFKDHIDLYEHIDDPAYIEKEETFDSWYENSDRPAGPLVSAGDHPALQGEPPCQRAVRRTGAEARPARYRLSDLPAGGAPATTSPRPNRFSTPSNILERRRRRSRARPCPAAISASSWERAP